MSLLAPHGFGALAAVLLLTLAAPASALDLIGLSDRNEIVLFNAATLGSARVLPIAGAGAPIIGIDVRPRDKKLYGLGKDSTPYIIDPATGQATTQKKLSVAFDGSRGAVVDFNPQADRLRVMSPGGQNLRVNVDTGEVAMDKPLAYKSGDAGAGRTPLVTAGAYINSFAGATQTQLFDYDSARGAWVLQDPPNDGQLATIGISGLGDVRIAGLDILTDTQGDYHCFAVSGSTLYRIDVATGGAIKLGTIGNGRRKLVDIAFVPVR
jgi:hypothetical protein